MTDPPPPACLLLMQLLASIGAEASEKIDTFSVQDMASLLYGYCWFRCANTAAAAEEEEEEELLLLPPLPAAHHVEAPLIREVALCSDALLPGSGH